MNDNRFVYNGLINHRLSTTDISGYPHYQSYYFNGEIHTYSDLNEISFFSSNGQYTTVKNGDNGSKIINRFGENLR